MLSRLISVKTIGSDDKSRTDLEALREQAIRGTAMSVLKQQADGALGTSQVKLRGIGTARGLELYRAAKTQLAEYIA